MCFVTLMPDFQAKPSSLSEPSSRTLFLVPDVFRTLPCSSIIQDLFMSGSRLVHGLFVNFSLEVLTHWRSHLPPSDHIDAPAITSCPVPKLAS